MEKLMSLQTTAAYPKPPASQSRPVSTHTNSSSSTDSTASSTSISPERETDSAKSSSEFVRCSRCQRSASISSDNVLDGMVRIGLNSYYCSRCANIVGFRKKG